MSQLFTFPPTIPLFLLTMTISILLTDLFLPKHIHKSYWGKRFIYLLSILTLLFMETWIALLYPYTTQQFFTGHFIWDPLTAWLSLVLIGISLLVFIYAYDDLTNRSLIVNDYYLLTLFSLLGMLVLISAGSLLIVYLGLELMSLPLYALVSLERRSNVQTEAAMKYIIMGVVASALLLYGFSFSYGISQSLMLDQLSPLLADTTTPLLLKIASLLILVAFLFKLGVAPFHFWVPDVYQSAATAVTLWIATVPKLAGLGILLRIMALNTHALTISGSSILLVFGIISLVIGNLIALVQTELKRLLAYSSIGHLGFIVLSLALPNTGYKVAIFYGISYGLMITMVLGALAQLTKRGLDIRFINELRGLGNQHPSLAGIILVGMSAMAGIPPFLGFLAKLGILQLLIIAKLYSVACIVVMASAVGAYYYFNIIKIMYFETPEKASLPSYTPHYSFPLIILLFNAIALVGFGVFPDILIHYCERMVESLLLS